MESGVIAEIRHLHEWFDARHRGAGDQDNMGRMEAALTPGFTMATPDGAVLDRAAVIEAVRAGHGRGGPRITVASPRILWTEGALTATAYEEWHHTDAGSEGQISTAVFRADPDAPNGVVRLHVHETRLSA